MILGKTLHNERGDDLLKQGVVLTERYVELLRGRRYRSIYVAEPGTEDLLIEDVLSDRVRSLAARGVSGLVQTIDQAARRAAVDVGRDAPERVQRALESNEFRHPALDSGALQSLLGIVATIIDEVMDADLLAGLTTLKAHDNYTFLHSVDVTATALLIGRKMHLDRGELVQLALGCMLHDVGNVFVDARILDKPGSLTGDEMTRVKRHASLGYSLLRSLQEDYVLANHVAYQHHERQNGSGYPRGLRGSNRIRRGFDPTSAGRILYLAEIAAVADVYDALSSDRPYRPALPPEMVVETIRSMAGVTLNREVVAHLLSMLPVFPIGVDVRVTAGRYRGYQGVVTGVTETALDRPRVRLVRDGDHYPLTSAFEIDLAEDEDTRITTLLADR